MQQPTLSAHVAACSPVAPVPLAATGLASFQSQATARAAAPANLYLAMPASRMPVP